MVVIDGFCVREPGLDPRRNPRKVAPKTRICTRRLELPNRRDKTPLLPPLPSCTPQSDAIASCAVPEARVMRSGIGCSRWRQPCSPRPPPLTASRGSDSSQQTAAQLAQPVPAGNNRPLRRNSSPMVGSDTCAAPVSVGRLQIRETHCPLFLAGTLRVHSCVRTRGLRVHRIVLSRFPARTLRN